MSVEYIAANKGSYALVAKTHANAEVSKLTIVGWQCGWNCAHPVFAGRYDYYRNDAVIGIPEPDGNIRIVDNGKIIPATDFRDYVRSLAK